MKSACMSARLWVIEQNSANGGGGFVVHLDFWRGVKL